MARKKHDKQRKLPDGLPVRANEGRRHGNRAGHVCPAFCERGKLILVRAKERVLLTMSARVVAASHVHVHVVHLRLVCMCREARPIKANVLADRFLSRTSHTAHRSRSETPWSTHERKVNNPGPTTCATRR